METTAASIAQRIGVTPQQAYCYDVAGRAFKKLRESVGYDKYEARRRDTFNAVLCACIQKGAAAGLGPASAAAWGVLRSVDTARLCPVAALKLRSRPPYQICELLARIIEEVPHLCSANVDQWLRDHKDEL